MNKTAIKNYAIWARVQLIEAAKQRAYEYEITENGENKSGLDMVGGRLLTKTEKEQRNQLISEINRKGFSQVMEEAAYTWFNRFIALRFMEVNGYLPSYTRVFSDDSGAFNPQILKDAIHLDLNGLDMEKVYAFEEADETEALFKYLVITQCNDLNRMLPGMFQKIADYTELLFPDFLLREGSVAHQMVTTIPEEDWKDAVQIIGWLYQYYNAEPKDEVFAALKKNIKISKEKIPAATQLFTPDWIVRYMVENSLGRLWVEGHPNDELKAGWKYYLEETPQEPEVEQQLTNIRAEYAQIDPATILCVDPCMGSGHILVYMFDVLMQIYLSYGYTTNEAVESIVKNNLWGMDIDDRAAQLAYFAVMMKAQQYDKRWLAKQVRHPVQPNVFALQDSGDWHAFEQQMRQAFAHHPSLLEDASIKTAKALFETFADAKEYGSIIQPNIMLEELNILENTLEEMAQRADLMDFVAQADAMTLMETLKPLILQCRGLVQKYHSVVTNPPYMAVTNANRKLFNYVKAKYTYGNSDLFGVMMERCMVFAENGFYVSMITQNSWMYLSSFEKMRHLLQSNVLINMAHIGARGFDEISGEVVQTTAFVIQTTTIHGYVSIFKRLTDGNSEAQKSDLFFSRKTSYAVAQDDFSVVPSSPIVYWLTKRAMENYKTGVSIDSLGIFTGQQNITADNEKYLRLLWEISNNDIGKNERWIFYAKGGPFRRWYGNIEYVVDWSAPAKEFYKANPNGKLLPADLCFAEGITYTEISSGANSFRYLPPIGAFDKKGPSIVKVDDWEYCLGFFNSCVAAYYFSAINPTISLQIRDVKNTPIIIDNQFIETVKNLVNECIESCHEEWDSYETSWDFQKHPLVALINRHPCFGEYHGTLIAGCFELWQALCEHRFKKLKANEEELNRIFIDIYGLQDELTPDVDDKDVTVRKADLGREIRSLISYAVGCMLGRYSLDKPSLAFAGGTWSESQYITYHADHDGILPITDDEYFDDDIVGMFIDWVCTVYGAETLEANLKFIANALGGKGNPRDVIRQYFLNDFYKDHLKVYQKRPIYWLFDSGKKNGFKCLIYMHRYQPDTIARIRTDYVHETQARYRTAIETLEKESTNASTSERVKLQKRITNMKAQAEELRVYEEKIHHLADQMIPIDLDDGVKVNYAKFADVLAPIK